MERRDKMLLSDIIRVGRPIIESKMSIQERIQLLTDVGKDEVKNFYANIFIIELKGDQAKLHYRSYQQEANGMVDLKKAAAIPITLPSGGNPLNPQGIYPLPFYPMYERHINQFEDKKKTFKMVHDRMIRTVPYFGYEKEALRKKAEIIANCITTEGKKFIQDGKQLGVLVILDYFLDLFSTKEQTDFLQVLDIDGERVFIDSNKIVSNIVEARFQEAKELGTGKNQITTISNEPADEVVSAYNKSWLWLSPTWEAPRSIYWKKNEWTKGIRLNREEYEAFFYGTQFLKRAQTRIRSSILKEMFAPTFSPEAKAKMNPQSFETIYAIPYLLPLTENPTSELFNKFRNLITKYESKEVHPNDIHLEIISGLEKKVIRNVSDDYRLSILYYSGNLGRGDIHLRAQIEDVVPSTARKVQGIIEKISDKYLKLIAEMLFLTEEQTSYIQFKVKYLPSLLSNAYGPGYLWSSMETVLHGRPIKMQRVTKQAARRILELANKKDFWNIKLELLFYHLFAAFFDQYHSIILGKERKVFGVQEWKELVKRYLDGSLTETDFDSTEKVAFITGLLMQQFNRSYYRSVGKEYLETRVMRFGSALTPEIIWKKGLVEMEGLRMRRSLKLAENYFKALPLVLQAVLKLKEEGRFTKEKDEFMTMFWSGFLMLPTKEEAKDVNS